MMKKFYSILTTFVAISALLLSTQNTFGQGYFNQLAQQCNGVTGGTETMSFTGTFPNANGNGTLVIVYAGDLNSAGEIVTFNGETGPALGITNLTAQCTGVDSNIYSIPMATINAWAATGAKIDITAVGATSVNALGSCVNGVTNSFCVTGRLSYPFATGPNDAGASAITPAIICPGSDSVKVQVNNYGTNQIDSVWVNWRKNGTLQTPIHLKTLLDTATGTGSSSAIVNLGLHTFTAGTTEIFDVWTSMPNGVIDTTVNNDSTSAGIKPSLSGTYTIGGASPDYTTFAAALSDLNSIGVCGPIVFNVRQGTYTEQIDIGSIAGVSSVNTITFQADAANTSPAIISYAATTAANNYVVKFDAAEYVTIDSLTITATGTIYGRVVDFSNAEYITLKNCEINTSTTSTSSNFAGIYSGNGPITNHCTIENNTIRGGYYGVYLYGSSGANKEIGNSFINNRIEDFYYYGLFSYYQGGIRAEGNSLEQRTSSTSTTYGMYMYYNDSAKVKANEVILHSSSTNYGIRIYYNYGSATNKVEVTNNMITTSATSTGTSDGLNIYYGKHINVYHNSVNCRGGSATAGRALYVNGSSSTTYGDVDVRNNIFTNSGPGVAAYVLSGAVTGGFFTNFDYNIYHSAGTNLMSYSGVYHTMASWRTLTSFDANSINAVPGFFSSTDLHVQGGVAADAGANVGVMVDFDGDVRPLAPSTGYDIGADEYIPPTCPMGYGLTDYGLTATSADITWVKGSSDSSWIFEYGAPGFTPGTGTSISSGSDSITITGLSPTTDYCVYVRGLCAVGDTSLYFGPYCFKTRCTFTMSGIYTIDNSSPTAGTNYNSFADALTALYTCGISGPTTFNVKQGTYTEQVDISAILGTSSVNTISFKADPTNTAPAILSFSSSLSTANYVVRFSGAEHIIIDSLTLNATGTTYGRVVDFTNAEYVTVKNCEINTSTTSTSSNFAGIYNASGLANVTNHCTVENNNISGGYYGIYFYGNSGANKEIGNNIIDNTIDDFYYYGLYSYYQGGIRAEGNSLEQRTSSTSTTYGMYMYYNDSAKVKANEVILHSSSTNYGIRIYYNYGSATNKVEVINNMITTSATSTGTSDGLNIYYGKHINVYHNSVNCRGGSATAGRALYVNGSSSTIYGDVDVRNNIFTNSGPGVAAYVLSGAVTGGFFTNFDYNIYHSAGTNLFSYSGAYHTMASWRTLTSFDANSINAVPGFFSSTNLHLQGGVAADAGANVGVMTDIDGDVRPLAPSTGYDIGADEYIPPTCPSGYGLTTFNVTATTAEVTWIAGSSDISWEFEHGASGFTPGSGTTIASANDTALITGLSALTNYDVYVRGICGAGDTSIYFGPYSFRTRCLSTMSGIYTIDGATPTGGTNYNTFADALTALYTCGISAPTTFNVKQGTYTEQVDISAILGTTPTNTITFTSDPTNTAAAILTFSSTLSASNYVVRFSGAEHIIIDSLTINATGATYGRVVDFVNAEYVTVKNCDINTSTTSTSSNFVGIYNTSGLANVTNHCTVENNNINGGYYGIYFYGNSGANKEIGNSFVDNSILDFYYYGIYSYYQGGFTVDGNNIEQRTSGSTAYGMRLYYNDSTKVRGNTVILHGPSTNYGLYVYYNYGSATNKVEIINNMVSTSATSTGTCYGMYLYYGKHINVYHNSFNIQGGSATAGRALYVNGSTSATYGNVDIRNNIFSNTGLGNAAYFTTGAISSYLDELDYNVYDALSGNLININGTVQTSLAAHVSSTGLDSNSLNGFPGFVSGTDLHLLGAIAYDNGDPTVGVMTDIDGDPRPLAPSTGWDIGADEYTLPSCPSAYSLNASAITTTGATIGWTNGPNDISWEIEYGVPGYTVGAGTRTSSASNPAVVTGLTASTCYEIYIRSICAVGDTSVWQGPVKFCTKCAPVSDYCTNFDLDVVNQTPFCWKTYINTTATAAYVQTYNNTSFSAPNCVRMYNQNDASAVMMLIAPEVTTASAGTHRMSLNVRADTTVIVGTMSDPTNPGTFIPWDTLTGLSNSGYTNFRIPFTTAPAGHTVAHVYPAILWVPGATYDYVYIDDYCWEKIPSCEKAPAVTVLNPGIDSTSLNIGWNYDTTTGASAQVSYIVAYGPVGYDPVLNPAGGATTTSTFNFANVTGLQPLTEYCFWVKAICANGDTSIWSGPYCGSTGCPDGIRPPYFDDFTDYQFVSGVGEQLPQCWSEGKGQLGSSSNISAVNSLWTYDGFANVGGNGSGKMNVNYTNRWEWLVSPTFYLGTDVNVSHWVEFDAALTQAFSTLPAANGFGFDDTVALVVSYDKGITWKKSDIIMQWDSSNAPSNTGTHIAYAMTNTTGYVTFGFYGTSSVTNENVEFFVDNFSIRDTLFVGVVENELIENFRVYPNPNNGVFTIVNEGEAQRSSVKLLDIQGRVVYDSQYNFTKNGRKEVQVNNLTSGVYVLLIQSEGKTEQHRIVVQ